MESLRVTGLMSGLDTNSIVDAYMTSAKAPIVKLNQEIDELNFEKTTYNNIISMITDVKNSMLSLKMESTFKSKVTASTNEDVATAVAGINTPTGSYTLNVDQVAEPAYASSIYTNKVLAQAGAGISSFKPAFSPYDQLEGTHNVEIYQGSNYGYNDKWFAKDTFTGNGNETYMVNHADKADKTLVNGNGELTQDVKGDFTFVYTYNGEQKNFTINMDYAKGTSLNKIAADMELEINAKMDALHSNNSEQTMKVTLNLDDDGFNFSFYDIDTQNEIEVLGLVQSDTTKIVQDMKQTFTIQQTTGGATNDLAIDLDIKAGTDINDVATEIKNQLNTTHVINADVSVKYNEKTSSYEFTITDPANSSTFSTLSIPDTTVNLGLYATYKSQSTKEITNIMVSNSAEKLGAKLNSGANNGSFITGTFEFEDGKGVQVGKFQVYQDSSAVCRPETYTTFYGDTFDKITNANPPIDRAEIDKWLNTPIGSKTTAGNTFFDDGTAFEGLNGVFYINGTKIEIEDYKQLTPNELMAKVNGSGAGVTMSYDYEKNIFQVKNNTGGAVELTMGNDTDTSNFFELFKVGLNHGATYVRGQNKGSLDTATVISKLDPGFSYPITQSGTFTINGVSIYVDVNNDTIQDVIDKVNKSGAGVTMAYDTNTDKFSLTSNSNERIKVGGPNDSSPFLLSIGLVYHQQTEQTIGSEGTKAEFTLNGTKYTRDTNEVSDVVPGMTFNISSTGTTVFNVKTDTDKAVKAVAEFASKYNTLINALNPTEIAYNDDLRSNYSEPLTDDKKATMSEDEIKTYQENYEKITYYDLISKSSEIRSLKTGIRANLSSTVNTDNSKYHTIFDVGFVIAGSDTRNTEVTKLGLLFDVSTDPAELETYIKESTDFVSTLSEDPDGVYNFFAASETVYETDPTTGKETSKIVNVGWGKTYSDYLDTTINSTSALYKKTSTNGTIESEISSIKEQIDAKTRRVEMYLERLYAQFAAMEERVGALQQSASYLTNLGSSGTSK